MKLKVTKGNAAGTSIDVEDELVIGRGAGEVGRLAEDIEISRRHARIFREGSGFAVEDLGSTNGTFLNGRRLEQPELLGVGDKLEMGGTTMIVQVSAAATPREGTAVQEPGTPPPGTSPPAAADGPAQVETSDAGAGPVPPLALRVQVDVEAGEASIELDEGADAVRLVLEEGRWRIRPQD
ncbi:MAG TPA: FHA domain-containing protein [Thermoleophilaceae bacterium]|nr:FHA domain-containing protein [Thermoleophilaceae bacterium]